MKLPIWFKIVWWVIITGLTTLLFSMRISSISKGESAPVDIFIFLVLVALLLVPIFQEISFFGLKFKQSIDDLQKNISAQLAMFKADIQTTISNTSNINVTLPHTTPTDAQLPNLEQKIKTMVSEALQESDFTSLKSSNLDTLRVEDDIIFLFKTRYTIENKLRNIASTFTQLPERSIVSINTLSGLLVKEQLLHPKIAQAIREIYSVCSPAIHGDLVTKPQVNFVRDVAPQVIEALIEIERRTTLST